MSRFGETIRKLEELQWELEQLNKEIAKREREDCEDICGNCNGSGEGRYDGTTCWHCKGKGVV